MKELLDIIKNIINKYKAEIILSLALILSLIFLAISCSNTRDIKRKYEINTKALVDTIEYYQSKSGKLVAEKNILEGDIKDLKTLNEELYNEIKDLKVKKPQQVIYVETEVVNEVHDTTYVVDPNLSYQKKDFSFNNKYRELEGFMELKDNNLGLSITRDNVYVDYTLAIKDNKVYLTSSNPYVRYNEIQGLTVPKTKKPKFGIGIGPSFGVGYDIVNKKPGVYAGLSVNIDYMLVTF